MKVTVRLLGTELLSIEVAGKEKPKPEAETATDREFGFHGGRGATINERAPVPAVNRRSRAQSPVNPR